jgi:hypothetical protein
MSALRVPIAQLFYEGHDSLLRRRSLKQYMRFAVDLDDLAMGSTRHIALISDAWTLS